MKVKKYCKFSAILLVLSLLTAMLGACAGDRANKDGPAGSGPGDGSGAARGGYVEKEVPLPPELADCTVQNIYAVGNTLHLLVLKNQSDKLCLQEWTCQDGVFTEVTRDWLAGLALPDTDWLEARLLQDSEGTQYLYAGYAQETDSDYAFKSHLWKGTADGAAEITPEKWTVPADEELGGYVTIQGLSALDNGTLAVLTYSGMDILSAQDGSVLASEPSSTYYEGNIAADGKNIYLCSSNDGGQIEKRKDGKKIDALTIPFPSDGAANISVEGAISFGSGGSLFVDALPDGALIAAGEAGIFRLPAGASDYQWEKLMAGIDTDFSTPDCWCMNMAALENGGIYTLFSTDDRQKLNYCQYDPDAVLEVTQVLKLYTLYDHSLLRQAAAMYHKLHPEVRIDIESELPLYSEDVPDYDTIYKKLNTRLFGDDAPDILVMDRLNMDIYAGQGLLQNLEDLIRPLEESGELLSNITGAYREADGRRYVVPLQFDFLLALGRDIPTENMSSMETLADFLSKADSSYMGERTAAGLINLFYPYFCEKIVHDKKLDRETLGKYLGYLKTIADNCGVIDRRSEEDSAAFFMGGMWDLASKSKLAFQRAGGFTGCISSMSMVDLVKGDFTAFENSFIPSLQVGICAKSRYADTAIDFLRFALSRQVQDIEYSGFPVNSLSLREQSQKDRSAVSLYTMIPGEDGSSQVFESKPYSAETAGRLVSLCEQLKTPTREDAKIREVLIECLEEYLKGTRPLEDTLKKIEDGLKMYLAE